MEERKYEVGMLDKYEIDKDISWDKMRFNYGINLYKNFFIKYI